MRKVQKNNRSGVPGVSFNTRTGKYVAKFTLLGKQKHLGYYSDIVDAMQALDDYKDELIEAGILEATSGQNEKGTT